MKQKTKQLVVNVVRGYYLTKNKLFGKLIDAMESVDAKDIERELMKMSYNLIKISTKDANKFAKWKHNFAPECK